MTIKHTPAPWNIQKPRHFPNSENVHLFIVSGSALVSIMPELQSERTEESEANARLIAAAPELLEALNYIEAYCSARAKSTRPEADKDDLLELASIARQAARAAILKAEG